MKVVYWARMGLARPQVTAALQAVPGTTLTVVETLPDLLAALPSAEALVTYDAPAAQARQVVQASGSLRWLHILTAGREGFEEAGLPRHIPVSWAAGAVAPAVAEHAMALLLALGRQFPTVLDQQRGGHWDRGVTSRATSLEGGTMAIIGLGHIGQELAPRARAFGMRVEAVTRSARPSPLVDAVHPLPALPDVLGRADAVVVAINLAPATRHLFNAAAFAACKRGALFINVGRGGLVDQAALVAALRSGQLGGAGVDVTDPEPLPDGDPLWSAPNLILAPHYAASGSGPSMRRIAEGAAGNLRRLMAGEPLLNLVED